MKRYMLDLSELFTDHRRKAYIGYRPTWTTVASVICTIRSTFNIQSDLYICSEDGIYYPEDENAELICEEKVIQVLPKENVAKESILSDDTGDRLLQESSTYEDIEATLLGLSKPKRRRVRKRKTKQDTCKEPSQPHPLPRPQEKVPKPVISDTERNGHIRFSHEESHSRDSHKSSDEVELPYRNLDRTMKARVVRAVSPSTLIDRSCSNGSSEPSAATTTTAAAADESANIEQAQLIAKPNIKARIVRATNGTVAVKQEQLEASATEQSYHPQTAVDDTEVIEIDAPTHVNGEEDTHGETPAE